MSKYKVKLGKYGEQLAADFISRRGYRVIARNFYTHHGELDLIAENSDEILFIEVKTRSNNQYGYPEQAVEKRKVSHLLKAIGYYLNSKRLAKFWRLDILAVEIDMAGRQAKIRWFKDAGRGF